MAAQNGKQLTHGIRANKGIPRGSMRWQAANTWHMGLQGTDT